MKSFINLSTKEVVHCLSDFRLEILSERAGGHCVGAPATREEERAMALELLTLRKLVETVTQADQK